MHQPASRPIARKPEVEQRRDDVAVEGEDRDRVQDLGVRGVERGEEDRVEEEDVAEASPSARTSPRAACGTRGCRRGPCRRRGCRASAPSSRRRSRRTASTAIARASAPGWRGAGGAAAVRRAAGSQPGGDQRGGHGRQPARDAEHCALPEGAERAQRLARSGSARSPQHRLGQPGRRAAPGRQQQAHAPGGRRTPAPPTITASSTDAAQVRAQPERPARSAGAISNAAHITAARRSYSSSRDHVGALAVGDHAERAAARSAASGPSRAAAARQVLVLLLQLVKLAPLGARVAPGVDEVHDGFT